MDNKLPQNRLDNDIKITEFQNIIDEIQYLRIDRCIVNTAKVASFGFHLFSNTSNTNGTLEDIVIPLLESSNKELVDVVETFLNENNLDCDDYNKEKSIIGVVGQLCYSGSGNADIIKRTNLITQDQINRDVKCQEVISFVKELRQKLYP